MPKIDLSSISTRAPEGLDKESARKISRQRAEKIAELQQKMLAEGKHSLLIVFQGTDGSGKDGAMRRVFGQCSPFGVKAVGWKKPTDEEFAHDFLWRIHKQAPAKGEIVIFNRSHYEDVLIQRVHGWISEERVDQRIASINAFEKLLMYDNNTTILKFYLHISREQQEIELMERINEPEKHHKHNDGDWVERRHWDKYRQAYEDVLERSEIPWHIIPVDQRWYRDYLMTDIVLKTMESWDMQWPDLDTERDW